MRGAVEDPGGAVAKTVLEGLSNGFLISLWARAVNFSDIYFVMDSCWPCY